MKRSAAYDILRRVRDELEAARFALRYVLESRADSPTLDAAATRQGITNDELARCARNLEVTFVLRLFSDFEAILRDYWRTGMGRRTEPEMRRLMDSIAARRVMNADDLRLAHHIREYRNDVIHERLRDPRFDFPTCARAIGKYLFWLPEEW